MKSGHMCDDDTNNSCYLLSTCQVLGIVLGAFNFFCSLKKMEGKKNWAQCSQSVGQCSVLWTTETVPCLCGVYYSSVHRRTYRNSTLVWQWGVYGSFQQKPQGTVWGPLRQQVSDTRDQPQPSLFPLYQLTVDFHCSSSSRAQHGVWPRIGIRKWSLKEWMNEWMNDERATFTSPEQHSWVWGVLLLWAENLRQRIWGTFP